MTDVYNALISRDLQKKRKKWIDGRVTIENSSKVVKVFEVLESGLCSGKQLYTGIIDVKMLVKLIETEEVKLGSLLVCITEKDGNCTTSEDRSVHSTAPLIPVRLKLPVFKQPLKNHHVMGTVTSQDYGTKTIGESKTADEQRLLHVPENLDVAIKADYVPSKVSTSSSLTTPLHTSSMFNGTINSRDNGNEKTSTRDGNTGLENIRISQNEIQNILSQPKHSFLQLRLYNHLQRFCMVGESFKNPNDYAAHFSAALWEEIQLSIASNMSSLEGRALASLGINYKEVQPLTAENIIGKGITGPGAISRKLCKPLFTTKVAQRPSIEASTEKLRSAGIPFTNRVEVILSQPRTGSETGGSWVKMKGNTTFKDRCDEFGSSFPMKRSKYDSDSGQSKMRSNGSYPDSGSVDASEEHVTETKLYFKILDGKHKIAPNGEEMYRFIGIL